jgi:hypothetical protein
VVLCVLRAWHVVQTPTLVFDLQTVSDILYGRITKWNHGNISALNPGVALPNADIRVVVTTDAALENLLMTNALANRVPDWTVLVSLFLTTSNHTMLTPVSCVCVVCVLCACCVRVVCVLCACCVRVVRVLCACCACRACVVRVCCVLCVCVSCACCVRCGLKAGS